MSNAMAWDLGGLSPCSEQKGSSDLANNEQMTCA